MWPAVFYEWFLAELIASLQALDRHGGDLHERGVVTQVFPAGQMSRVAGRQQRTPVQANLRPRPRQPIATVLTSYGAYALGDAQGFQPLPRRTDEDAAVVVPSPLLPYAIPCPPLPVVMDTCGVTLDAYPAGLPSYPLYPASDGYVDAGFPRTSYPNPVDGMPPLEPSGVLMHTGIERYAEELHPRLEHLAKEWRPNIRLPYAAGVDEDGFYVRMPMLPMASCRAFTSGIST